MGSNGVAPATTESERFLTIQALSSVTGWRERKIRHLIAHHGMPVHRFGRDIQIRYSEFNDWLESRRSV